MYVFVSRLLKPVIVPKGVNYKAKSGIRLKSHKVKSKEVHKTTFGVNSNPLVRFAAVFLALVHNVDHDGVTN